MDGGIRPAWKFARLDGPEAAAQERKSKQSFSAWELGATINVGRLVSDIGKVLDLLGSASGVVAWSAWRRTFMM